jgi:hypothetical protein
MGTSWYHQRHGSDRTYDLSKRRRLERELKDLSLVSILPNFTLISSLLISLPIVRRLPMRQIMPHFKEIYIPKSPFQLTSIFGVVKQSVETLNRFHLLFSPSYVHRRRHWIPQATQIPKSLTQTNRPLHLLYSLSTETKGWSQRHDHVHISLIFIYLPGLGLFPLLSTYVANK